MTDHSDVRAVIAWVVYELVLLALLVTLVLREWPGEVLLVGVPFLLAPVVWWLTRGGRGR